ncbi:MAG: hypothetical protein J6Z49_06280 [Kiritimatiellae bacterium]|nr:hypothetical protein [Kiritimatiellia bacterium]
MPTAEWIFEHVAPGWLLAAVFLASLLFSAYWAWRFLPRNGFSLAIAGARFAFLLTLFWILLLPGRKHSLTEIVKPRFLVLLDTSASMTQTADDSPAYKNRWEAARAMLTSDGVKRIASRCLVETYPFQGDLGTPLSLEQAVSLTPDGRSSHLNLSLSRLFERLRGQTVAGVLMLTDGIDTREKNDLWASASWKAPIYTVRLEKPGTREERPDMRVENVDTPHRAVVGWDTQMTVTISGQGGKGEPFPVVLLKNGKEVEKVAVQLPPEGGSRDVQFKLTHPAVAAESYLVRIPVLPDEVQTNDNEMVTAVDVLDAKNRVLFLEDVPRFESKHFSRALFANKDITPLAFFQMPDRTTGAKQWVAYGDRQGGGFDLTPEQLRLNKIVILGDFDSDALTPVHCQAVLEFVEKGGSLILLGGQKLWGENGIAKTSLSKLLPFTRTGGPAMEGRFAVEWTAEGRAHPALAQNKEMPQELPPVLSVFAGAKLSGGAFALANARTGQGEEPILISRNYGQGKVLAVLTDSLWRWQMQPGQGREKPYPKFWRQIVQWMSPSETEMDRYFLELFTDAGTIAVGDPAILQARLALPPGEKKKKAHRVVCTLTTPSDRAIPFAMEDRMVRAAGGEEIPSYVTEFTPEEPGTFKAVAEVEIDGQKIHSSPCLFSVRATSQELVLKPLNETVLRELARSSGGRYGDSAEINRVLEELAVEERRERKLEYRSLWHSPFLLVLLITFVTFEWILRKARNMP